MYNNAKKIVCSSQIIDCDTLGIFIHYLSDNVRKNIISDLEDKNKDLLKHLSKSNFKNKTHFQNHLDRQ